MSKACLGRPTKAIINLRNYRKNLSTIKRNTQRKIMAVVKSNAYGHGIIPMATYVEDVVDSYAVAILEEAEKLRRSGIRKPILVLGYVNPLDLEIVIKNEICITIHSSKQWQEWKKQLESKKNLAKVLNVHIKINTGMNRLGFNSKMEFVQVLDEIKATEGICVDGIFTHFATADTTGDPLIDLQETRFKSFIEEIDTTNLTVHIANSAYTLCRENAVMYDMVRIGISGYGMLPDHNANPFVQTNPLIELKTAIVAIQELEKGDTVGYGASYKAEKKEQIGIIPIGYGDGLFRTYAKKGYVLVNGKKRRFAGDRICMDQSMIILGDGDKIGDEVVIYGKQGDEQITLEMAGDWAETINYELSCALGERLRREYIF